MNAEMPIAVIIDDDADIRTLLDRVLTQSGFQTVLTANAFDGVAAVEEFSPLVTMLDVSMPGMDGFAFARALRQEGPWRDLPLIALTSRGAPEDIERGRSAGFTDYVAKFDRAALLESLAQCLAAPVLA